MPENSYDVRRVSLRRPRGNGDLDIVRASYTRRKANVTEAFVGPTEVYLLDFIYSFTVESLSSCYILLKIIEGPILSIITLMHFV